ncbi:MAG: deoxyguanosinetriphosphate triphosphohydrolase [Caldilineaceae bacterium]|nr:deoxyguanosinetriphosphate triphosphohydrolase [Caldilineaceae bacterium]MCB0096018.1 deoxyguanosinetriphosphate triphosphohydrolase [Caldilineaceae bacterium]MCB0141278.1 deoxyguanosinetriphosphate triphosphohydrolase [Caldilineaceae bacterium]
MIIDRQQLEQREEQYLAPYAMRSSQSRGRVYPETEHDYRTSYQRDRDRIIHTTAFRRLEYKTQVFVYSEGDHYRNRLTHSIEVAQVGRTLARALGCNEDLIEAICLAHDLGHPPFGHVGEATLNDLMRFHGGYDHQKQTYRIITKLEQRYPDHPGLNLTYEVREGVVKHDTSYDLVDARDYDPEVRGTLECQLSNLADEIAYNTSDMDDGLRSGILKPSEVGKLAIAQQIMVSLGETDVAALGTDDMLRHRFIRRLVGVEVSDTIAATARNIEENGVTSLDELKALPHNVAGYSAQMDELNAELKSYLYANFYRHYRVVRMATKAERVLRDLFEAYVEEPLQLPDSVQEKLRHESAGDGGNLHRIVCDYLAGMTDRYAIQEHKRLYDPEERV